MIDYAVIRVYTREGARFEGREAASAIVSFVHSLRLSARCTVLRGVEGCYESGELASSHIVDLSHDMPLVVDIVLPAAEAEALVSRLAAMVSDGVVALLPAEVRSFRSPRRLFPRNLLVADAMTRKPVVARPDYSARTLAELLLDHRLKALPVADEGGGLAGIVTQGDLMRRAGMPIRVGLLRAIPADRREKWLEEAEGIAVGKIMTPSPRCLREDQRLAEAVHLMAREKLKRLPVVDASRRIVGMLSRIDLLSAIAESKARGREEGDAAAELGEPRFVRDVTDRELLTLRPGTGLREAVTALAKASLQRAAVVDERGVLLGLVSDDILIEAMDEKKPGGVLARFLGRGGAGGVGEIMLRSPASVREDSSLDEALALMTERGFKRVPVVDEGGVFRGMLRRDAVLLALSRIV